MLRCALICSACLLTAAYDAASALKVTLEASADLHARHGDSDLDAASFAIQLAATMQKDSSSEAEDIANVGDHDERPIANEEQHVLDPGVAVSLLASKRHWQPATVAADVDSDSLRWAAGDSAPSKLLSQARGEAALTPSKLDDQSELPSAKGWLTKLERFPQGVHEVLSMTPGHMVAAATETVKKVSPVKIPNQADVVDMFTIKTWTTTTYTKLGIVLSAILLFVAQSIAAGDFTLSSCKSKDERGLPQESTWPSAEPASVFTLEAQGLLAAASATGGRAEIRGPADCPSLCAALSADRRGHLMKIGLSSDVDPLMILGPVRSWRNPEVMSVQRTSTGVIDSLEPLGPGRWALRRDGHTELVLKCDPWQRSVEVRALVQTHVQPREAPKLEEFEIEEEDGEEKDDGNVTPAKVSSVGEAVSLGGQRLIARATLRSCESAGGALSSDVVDVAMAAGEEVALPLSCIVAVLLMSPDILDARASCRF